MIDYLMDGATLAEVLRALPPGYKVSCNSVRNLAIIDPNGRFAGFIEVRGGDASEALHLIPEENRGG